MAYVGVQGSSGLNGVSNFPRTAEVGSGERAIHATSCARVAISNGIAALLRRPAMCGVGSAHSLGGLRYRLTRSVEESLHVVPSAHVSRRWRAVLPWLPQCGIMHVQLGRCNNPTAQWVWKPRTRGELPGLCVHALVRVTDLRPLVSTLEGLQQQQQQQPPKGVWFSHSQLSQ